MNKHVMTTFYIGSKTTESFVYFEVIYFDEKLVIFVEFNDK